MVDIRNKVCETHAKEISKQRHQCLESTEPQGSESGVTWTDGAYGKAFADRDCKGIHRYAYGDYDKFRKIHLEIYREMACIQAPFPVLNDNDIISVGICHHLMLMQKGMSMPTYYNVDIESL